MAQFHVFDAYVTEYNELLTATRTLLDDYRTTKKASAEGSITSKISQLDDCVKQMGIEAKSHDSSQRKLLQDRIAEYSKTLTELKGEFRRAQEQAGRSELIGEKSAADRARVMDMHDKYVSSLFVFVCVLLYVCALGLFNCPL
jgi:alpha-D-ribose 1-methylphosphonate 5-triphosphate diphosphatase PhnM